MNAFLHETSPYCDLPTVMLVCDDEEIASIWAHSLRNRHLLVILSSSVQELDGQSKTEFPDLIIVDINTPKLDEIDICRRIRIETNVPLLLFTPRNNEAHILEAYQTGVDECVAKPVSPALFLAKVNSWLRRSCSASTNYQKRLEVGDFSLDTAHRQVIIKQSTIVNLTNLEFRLLYFFMVHPSWILESDTIVEWVWGYAGEGDSVLLKNVVYRLRRKIEPVTGQPRYIITEAGLGYRFLVS
ncbi:MAG TPA: response regulator transcription factor [Patescibacteria group bacterium]|nr:response regulator transcription factor [Patescibacteria group bacterium]